MLSKSLAGNGEPIEGQIVLRNDRQRIFAVRCTELREADGAQIGALIVFSDVTRIRRLETMRRDFVANVSHELKTPITSIRGFVETLRDGAVADPEKAERFLEIVARQSNRLNAIIQDLLLLSRIEQDAETAGIALSPERLKPVLLSAIQSCARRAQGKRMTVTLECEESLKAPINGPLLEQALVNLIDNAIKYSPAEKRVEVLAEERPNEVAVTVRDEGCGIPEPHLSRVFERFYRVDTARSRDLGGTGLGLAIVKHIAQAHRGRVTVQSEEGRGSAFTVHLQVA